METWLLKPLAVAESDCKQNVSFIVLCTGRKSGTFLLLKLQGSQKIRKPLFHL